MNNGFIALHRKITEWEWYDDSNTMRLFIHLLLTANYEDAKWHGIAIKRGQKLTSFAHLSRELKLSVQEIRTAICHLKSTGEITYQSTNKYTVITIEKYSDYQCDERKSNKQANTQRNNQSTTNNKNNNNNKQYIYSAEAQQIIDYLNQKAGTTYRYTSKKNQTLIKARMDEHFTVEDFKKVIDIKVAEWKETDMAQYLRPITLFGTKFESYLNQKPQQSNNESDKIPWAKIP